MVQYAVAAPLALGAKAPNFSLKGTDDKVHALQDYTGKVLVVLFSCNHCPYVKAYEERMAAFALDYAAKGVDMVAINSNRDDKYPEDSFPEMKRRAKEKSFPFHYLRDDTQDVARAYGAVCTPHVFAFNAKRELMYQGALDDNWQNPDAVKVRYLRDAVDATLAGRMPRTTSTQPAGCSVKWK